MNPIANIEAEQAVLAAIILEPDSLDKIPWLEVADFTAEENRVLFEQFRFLHEAGQPIDLVYISENVRKYGNLEVNILAYFGELASSAVTAANIVYYADVVRNASIRRRGANIGRELENLSTGFTGSLTAYIAEYEKKLDELRPKTVNDGLVHIKETKAAFFKHMESEDDFIKTDSTAFDDWGGGYARKSLVIKAGRPSVGKTAQCLQDVMGIASQGEGAAAIFSQEMDKTQVTQRMIACKAGINYTRLRRKWVMKDKDEQARVDKAFDQVSSLPLYIKDTSGLTIQEIRSDCRRLVKEKGKLSVIMVDYLSLLDIVVEKGMTYPKAVGMVVWQCKQMAKEFDCIFMLVCMMGRSGEGTAEPKLSDLKESGDIEQHADVVEFLWVDPDDETDQNGVVVTRTIAKGRDTGMGKFKMLFKGYVQRFQDYTVKPREKAAKKK